MTERTITAENFKSIASREGEEDILAMFGMDHEKVFEAAARRMTKIASIAREKPTRVASAYEFDPTATGCSFTVRFRIVEDEAAATG